MSFLNPTVDGASIAFSMDECIAQGRRLSEEYQVATPFPHIVTDSLLPLSVLQRVLDEFPIREKSEIEDAHSLYKTGYTLERIKSRYIANLLSALNSAQFLRFLEEMTGIDGLISDPYYQGGGLHETGRGGHLSIHADFNLQKKLGLLRRLNLILYLNHDWKDEYRGYLELWHRDMSGLAKSVAPIIGRAVVFNTDDDSYHGHPDPLMSPTNVYRRSLALYYYTAPKASLDQIRQHSTQFKVRPNSSDRYDYRTRFYELSKDLCPPMLWRLMKRAQDKKSLDVDRKTA